MSFSLKSSLQFLSALNPKESSVALDKGALRVVKKRSTLANFFHRVLYVISLTLVQENKKLDQVTKKILSLATALPKELYPEEKELFRKGIDNLIYVIRKNGGREEKRVSLLLQTVEKIPHLYRAKKALQDSTTPPYKQEMEIEPQKKGILPPDATFKNFERWLAQAPPCNKESVQPKEKAEEKDLTPLIRDFLAEENSPADVSEFLKNLKGKKNLLKRDFSDREVEAFIRKIFSMAISQAPAKRAQCLLEATTALLDLFDKKWQKMILELLFESAPEGLLAEILNACNLEASFIEEIAKRSMAKDNFHFEVFLRKLELGALKKLAKYIFLLGNEEQKTLFSKALPPPSPEKAPIEEIPAKQDSLKLESTPLESTHLESTPLEPILWQEPAPGPAPKIENWEKVAKNRKIVKDATALQKLAQDFDRRELTLPRLIADKDFFASLLPFFDDDLKTEVFRLLIGNRELEESKLFEIAINLPQKKLPQEAPIDPLQKIWEEASKRGGKREPFSFQSYPPQILAYIVNGQLENPPFLKDFFEEYFSNDVIEKKSQCLARLNLKALAFENPATISPNAWKNYFLALQPIQDQPLLIAQDQPTGKELLIASTLHLFNAPGFNAEHQKHFYALSLKQMELLPIENYKEAGIKLLLACLTNRLNDAMIPCVQSLIDKGSLDFFRLLEHSYRGDSEEFEEVGKKALKKLILWSIDPGKIDPGKIDQEKSQQLSFWDWINGYLRLLEIDFIRRDEEIKKKIKDHGLKMAPKITF